MSEDLALSLLEELLNSQESLIREINDLTLQVELSDCIEIKRSDSAHPGH